MVLYCSNHTKPTQWCSTLSPHPCSIPLGTRTDHTNLSVGPENQKQKVTHYEFIADYYSHPDIAEKGVYVDGCAITKTLCFFTLSPLLKVTLQPDLLYVFFTEALPSWADVFNSQDNQPSPSSLTTQWLWTMPFPGPRGSDHL